MGSTRDFITSTLADALLPLLRRPVEDVVYETIDQRQVPTRTDFRELRDVVNELRGKVTQAAAHSPADASTDKMQALDEQVQALIKRIDALESSFQARIDALAPAAKVEAPVKTEAPAHKVCKVPGCEDSVRARGFCSRHYARWSRGNLEGFPKT